MYDTPYIEDWADKAIQIFATTTKLKGEQVECLRIRPRIPQVGKKPELTPEHPKWSGAVKSYGEGNIGLSGIREHFTLSPEK